jgi:hypothetical protein
MKEMQSAAGVHRYPMAPLIRYGLLGLYGALVLPLPLLAPLAVASWYCRVAWLRAGAGGYQRAGRNR